MTSVAIELRDLRKSWGDQQVIKDISLSIQKGRFTALLGPSGCGKSTLLRMIAGLERPDSGQVFINGQDVSSAEPAKRQLSMVFQSYALFPHLSVRDNILFGLQVRRRPKAEQKSKLAEALRLTNLETLADRKPGQLSGGQRQRVALARSIVSGHDICLMDEPLSNLDAKLRHSVRHEIRDLQQRLGLTVVYVTHDQTEAMGMADHVVLLREGTVAQQGTAQDLYEQPSCIFSAEFIGSPPMMLIHSDVVPKALWLDRTAFDQPHTVSIGIRPENLRLQGDSGNAVSVVVEHQEFQGAESYVYVRLRNQQKLIVRTVAAHNFIAGQRYGLTWAPEHAYNFDLRTGARLREPTYPVDAIASLHESLTI
ncbi:ABC transporter ATP-binding protein [Paenalcaligenes niemegkensis]|uniref:ABC transporter ATP-binding protein n=1 Tax=Paenalcaligenes niemegkensis TaxID=2895469 RepID=UPI001EE9165F|nr:ABC transporter ATP-binding protein [Paenalcaligenes niemegkensis]MCQ9616707.1 ABC transporter ATP-binding protein [Paenalcaligenes niemegkensis]